MNSQLKEKMKVVMLPTNKKAKIGGIVYAQWKSEENHLAYPNNNPNISDIYIPQHLYIVSNREIKLGDKYLAYDNTICERYASIPMEGSRKIEATTDKSLGLPLIPEGFVKKYVELQGKIDEVMVDMIEIANPNFNRAKGVNIYNPTYFSIPKTDRNNYITITKVEETWDNIWLKWRDTWDNHKMNYERWLEQHYTVPKKINR